MSRNYSHSIADSLGGASPKFYFVASAFRAAFCKGESVLLKKQGALNENVKYTPGELVNAIRYVTGNHTHHYGETGVDRFSSAALAPDEREELLAQPLGWLLRWGWKRARPRGLSAC